ncbi:uncharacterized protein METZ01_LOCUS331129, partial [marine metagenome]
IQPLLFHPNLFSKKIQENSSFTVIYDQEINE